MKRFLLFSSDTYYPGGGWDDFVADYDDVEAARVAGRKTGYDWFQVIDTTTMKEVESDGLVSLAERKGMPDYLP